nr:centriolin-like [Cherax quadricarinatus]
MCRINVEPMKVEDTFLHPEIPPWVENSKHAESIFSDSSSSVMDCSTSDGFGKGETSFAMDLAEQSKLGKLDASFDSPRRIISKRRKRVQFELGPPLSTSYCNVECQTEESLLSNISFFPSFPLTPKSGPKSAENLGSSSTPVHILRTRNEELQLKLEKQQEWLMDWQREIKELREFQKHEIQLLQESFSAKVHVESVDHAMLEEQRKEIMSLKHSLRDLEALLLDANRTVSQRSQEVLLLQEQIDNVNAENLRSSSFESELLKLRDEHKQLKKATENKDSRLKQLENERHDFDVMMELALKKKELKESDLRKSLDVS